MGLAAKIPALGRTLAFRGRPYEHSDWFDLYTEVRSVSPGPGDGGIHPDAAADHRPRGRAVLAGQSQQLSGLVPGRADVLHFGADEGADYHCQPIGRQLTQNRMFDWLAELSGPPRRAASSVDGPAGTSVLLGQRLGGGEESGCVLGAEGGEVG